MTETNNLQKSELVISKILQHLLDRGLQQGVKLEFQNIGLSDEYVTFFNGCCQWLLDEGIVRCANIHQPLNGPLSMTSPVITSRGFALLDQPFAGTKGEMRVGQAMRDVAEGQKNFAGIGDFVGGLLGGFTKSMGNG